MLTVLVIVPVLIVLLVVAVVSYFYNLFYFIFSVTQPFFLIKKNHFISFWFLNFTQSPNLFEFELFKINANSFSLVKYLWLVYMYEG